MCPLSHNACELEIPSEELTKAEVEEQIKLQRIRCAEDVVKKSFQSNRLIQHIHQL